MIRFIFAESAYSYEYINHAEISAPVISLHVYTGENSSLSEARKLFESQDYTGCIALIKSITAENLAIEHLALLAISYFENREFDQALAANDLLSGKIARTEQELRWQFNAFQAISELYWNRQDYEIATLWNRKAAQILTHRSGLAHLQPIDEFQKAKLAFGIRQKEADSLLRKVSVSFDRNDNRFLDLCTLLAYRVYSSGYRDSAFVWLDKGIAAFEQRFSTDTLRLINLELQKAYLHYESRDLKRSLTVFQNQVSPLIFGEHSANQKRYQFQKGEFYRLSIPAYSMIGDFEQCIRYGQKFLLVAPSFLDSAHIRYGEVYRDLAENYLKLNRTASFTAYMNKAVSIFRGNKFYRAYAPFYEARSDFYEGAYARSLNLCDSLLGLMHSAMFNGFKESVLRLKWQNLIHLGEQEKLAQSVQETLSLARENKMLTTQRYAVYQLYILTGREIQLARMESDTTLHQNIDYISNQMDAYYKEVIPLIENSQRSGTVYEAEIYCFYARHLIRMQKPDSILYYLDRASGINNTGQGGSSLISLMTSYYRGLYYEMQYRRSGDPAMLSKSVTELLDGDRRGRVRNIIRGTVDDKLNQIADFLPRYKDKLMQLLYESHELSGDRLNVSSALELLEHRKSALMLEHQMTTERAYVLDVPDSLLLRESSLRQQVHYLEGQLKTLARDSVNYLYKSFRYYYEQTVKELDLLNAHISRAYPDYHQFYHDPDYISLEEVQSELTYGEGLLHYYAGLSHDYIVAISKNEVTISKTNPLSKAQVRMLRHSLDPQNVNRDIYNAYVNFATTASDIYQSQLKSSIEKLTGVSKLYILPDGLLHHIPVEVLLTKKPDKDNVSFKKLSYLINDYTVSYGYSATTLFNKENNFNARSETRNEVLAMAPAYDNSDGQYGDVSSDRLSSLKWNEQEIQQISNQYDGRFLTGSKASKHAFETQHTRYGILHLAMHAIVDETRPMESYLVFSPQSTASETILKVHDVFEMRFDAEMLVLSACNTGYGKLFTGEGAMSLAKAFMYAGCESVVMSFWPADDQSSEEIMGEFYRNLSAGSSKDEALRLAKLAYFENTDPQSAAPAFWNNYVVSGNIRPIDIEKNCSPLLIISTLLLVTLLIVILLFRIRSRQAY